jgi:hypothetical protein
MQVIKSACLDDIQGSEAGQFGAWLCVGKILVLDGRKVWNFEHNLRALLRYS